MTTNTSPVQAYVIDGVRTPFGKAGGRIASVRPDDLAAAVIAQVVERSPGLSPDAVEDVYWGATNQAGDDSRNVARIAALLAGLPQHVGGATVNRLCGSGIEAVATAARAIKSGEVDVCVAGGSESMSRAPFILPRAETGYQRSQEIYDSRLGWRSVNPRWRELYGAKSLIECAEETAATYRVSRTEQDEYAVRSHQLATEAWNSGKYVDSVIPVKSASGVLDQDETIRSDASVETLGSLRPLLGPDSTITAGNASPMNDGAGAVLLASNAAVERYELKPVARVVGTVSIGVHPDGLDGPISATTRLLERIGWSLRSLAAVEMTEAYASQVVACVRELALDMDVVNAWGGAIAVGHPLAASGARLIDTLVRRLTASGGGRGVATMCIGVGQGISMAVETC